MLSVSHLHKQAASLSLVSEILLYRLYRLFSYPMVCVFELADQMTTELVVHEYYTEVDVTDWPVVGDESLGTKPKRWLKILQHTSFG